MNEFISRWNSLCRHDYWWRQKHNVAFNSDQHRAMRPSAIAFEFIENKIATDMLEQYNISLDKKKALSSGQWIKENEDNKKRQKELFDNLDVSELNG